MAIVKVRAGNAVVYRRFGHIASLSDVLAVFLIRHANPLFGHHLLLLFYYRKRRKFGAKEIQEVCEQLTCDLGLM